MSRKKLLTLECMRGYSKKISDALWFALNYILMLKNDILARVYISAGDQDRAITEIRKMAERAKRYRCLRDYFQTAINYISVNENNQ